MVGLFELLAKLLSQMEILRTKPLNFLAPDIVSLSMMRGMSPSSMKLPRITQWLPSITR